MAVPFEKLKLQSNNRIPPVQVAPIGSNISRGSGVSLVSMEVVPKLEFAKLIMLIDGLIPFTSTLNKALLPYG